MPTDQIATAFSVVLGFLVCHLRKHLLVPYQIGRIFCCPQSFPMMELDHKDSDYFESLVFVVVVMIQMIFGLNIDPSSLCFHKVKCHLTRGQYLQRKV